MQNFSFLNYKARFFFVCAFFFVIMPSTSVSYEHCMQHVVKKICTVCERACATLYACSECHNGSYCSDVCQKKDWQNHKALFHKVHCRACVTCKKPSDFQCSGCKKACYCSQQCQKSDWLNHKIVCNYAVKKCAACAQPTKHVCSACRNVYYCSKLCQKNSWNAHKRMCYSKQKTKQLSLYDIFKDKKTGAYELLLRAHEIFSLIEKADKRSSFFMPFDANLCTALLKAHIYAPIMLRCYKACSDKHGRKRVLFWLAENSYHHTPLLGLYLMLSNVMDNTFFELEIMFKVGVIFDALCSNKNHVHLLQLLEKAQFDLIKKNDLLQMNYIHHAFLKYYVDNLSDSYWLSVVDKVDSNSLLRILSKEGRQSLALNIFLSHDV